MQQRTKYLILIYILFILCGIFTSLVGFGMKSCNDNAIQSLNDSQTAIIIYDTNVNENNSENNYN